MFSIQEVSWGTNMQTVDPLAIIGILILVVGLLLIVLGLFLKTHEAEGSNKQETKSRGIILIGPIPIFWGFGSKGRVIAILAIALFLVVWLLLYYL